MNTKKYRWLLYTITLTIVATIAVQVYWNYKNYQQNKQRVINEIQLSLDNAIEEYFADIVKNDFITIVDTQISNIDSSHTSQKNWKLKKRIFGWDSHNKKNIDTIFKDLDISINSHPGKRIKIVDSLFKGNKPNFISDVRIFRGKKNDSIKLINDLKTIYLSIKSDSVQYQKLDSLLKNQLDNKNLNIEYRLTHHKGDSIYFNSNKVRFNLKGKTTDISKRKKVHNNWSGVNSKSTFLRHNEQFEVLFKDSSFEALKRSSTGILLSFLLSLTIISCLFYLLKIINKQKQLAEIKNDLISNITHEFKTPITTVSTALEAIDTFNAIDDKEKTKKYLSISNEQLKKLHHMVEKLLETATLDSEKLLLKKEQTDIVALIKSLATKDEFLATEKNIDFHSIKDSFLTKVDAFHFENAINNLLDNAIKYGGNSIEVHISFVLNNIEITIADNGNGIEKNQREKIFDKFYRIPKGNTHNVKGFGIGLYYTKKIIEKHGGKIHLVPNSQNTIFKITLPV